MYRDPREERLKFIRREIERMDELQKESRVEYLIELEKPQFAGWELYVDLSESGKRRRDAPDIMYLLNLFGMNRIQFVRNLTTIRMLRRAKYSYSRVQLSKKAYKSNYNLDNYYAWRSISEKAYMSIPDQYKKYFSLDNTKQYGWYSGDRYLLIWNALPTYEFVFKLKKAYWTHLKYYDGDAIGEYERLRHKIWYGSYRNDVIRASGWIRGRYRDNFSSKIKSAWGSAIKEIEKAANSYSVHDEDWDDVEQYLKDRAGVYNNKQFGWD